MVGYKLRSVGMTFISAIFVLFISIVILPNDSNAIHFTRTTTSYAKYPKWNACTNSSIAFDFKTTNKKALLMYTDDNGRYDYVEVLLKDGRVRLRMNIVDGRDGSVEITLGNGLNDNRWHSVEIKRNRMEASLYVDGQHDSRVAFGSDFNFGDVDTNNFVYFGGMPEKYYKRNQQNLKQLSLSSVYFENRLHGTIRNIIYWNCTCSPVRAEMIEGVSVSSDPPEACDSANTCGKCLCISKDDGPGCQCVSRECALDTDSYYHLPMDALNDNTLVNPSGLDAKGIGAPEMVSGVKGQALQIDGQIQKVRVSGPGHRMECFGDLSLCPDGYTIGLWLRVDTPGTGKGVYLSNGGDNIDSHGVAMSYKTGRLYWKFRMKNGREWLVTANNVLPRSWYHVMVTWTRTSGLAMYINGEKIAQAGTPSIRAPLTGNSAYNDFIIGQSNDGRGSRDLGTITIDDFQFWSTKMTETMLREKGPIYKYHITMDKFQDGQLIVPNLEPQTKGKIRQVQGKVGNAIEMTGNGEYIDLGSFDDTCLGNTSLCMYGLTASFWIQFNQLRDNSYYMASGIGGFTFFSYGDRLYTNVQNGDRKWQTYTSDMKTGEWYFVEVSWKRNSGIELFVNNKKMASESTSTHQALDETRYDNFYIGKANTVMYIEKYGAATIDDVKLYNADRQRLIDIDFIQRGKPKHNFYSFENMTGSRINHPSTVIETSGLPSLVPGKIGKALWLSGRLQTAQFNHGDDCLGNLDYCNHGAYLAFWFRPEKMEEGMFYLSSGINGLTISFVDRKLRVTASTSIVKWEVTTSDIQPRNWYFIEVTWHPETGLQLYSDNVMLGGTTLSKTRDVTEMGDFPSTILDKFVLGNTNGDRTGSVFGAATYDEMEYWYGSRDYLLALDYIQRGTPMHYIVKMDQIVENGTAVAHASLPVKLLGKPLLVSGKIRNAVQLDGTGQDGKGQMIDLGEHPDVCLGNLDKCNFGISIFVWFKLDQYSNNMYILSTGKDGIRIYYNFGYIYVTLNNRRKSWRASVPKISLGIWHFFELSWHPDFGMDIYVDHELRDHVEFITIPSSTQTGNRIFYIGGPNSDDTGGKRFTYADMAVDQLEIWYGRRAELLAFDYIIRDNVEYESFSMETASNGVIDHPRFRITLERGAILESGKVGNAVSLNGRGAYVDLGQHMDKCMANLDLCNHGITISLWVKPRDFKRNAYYLSSPTYGLYWSDGTLKSKFMSNGKSWNVETRNFKRNTWNNVILSWEPSDGLELFMDGNMVAQDSEPEDLPQSDQPSQTGNLYVGKASESGIGRTSNSQADEVQFWYANLEKLQAQGLYGGQIHEVLPLSQMTQSGVLKLNSRTITLQGGATIGRGQHFNAIQLNGKGQYIDLGQNLTCGGNLDNCRQGFTMRFSTKPDKLSNNMYFLDSYPLSIFYKDGKLYATTRTSSKTWTVAAPGFKTGEWQVVDVSWHPEIGLTMHVNDEEAGAHKTHGTDIDPVYDWDTTTYFGRALTNMRDERYADTTVENFEVWNVRRDVLVANNQLTNDAVDQGFNPYPDIPLFTPRPNPRLPPRLGTTTAFPVSNDADAGIEKVFVTRSPTGNAQDTAVNAQGSTSKIIRFFGNSFVRYDLGVLPNDVLAPGIKESIHLKFYTKESNGLMWIYRGTGGQKIYISVKNGALLFVMDDGRTLPQQVVVQDPQSRALKDRWVNVRVEKEGTTIKFYIDNQYVTEVTTNREVQFLGRGDIYLGGVPQTNTVTGGIVTKNFDGAITDVESRKFPTPSRELITSFLQFVESAEKEGDYRIWDWDDWNKGFYNWTQPTTRPPPTPAPVRPSPVTFTSASSVFYLKDPLDWRAGGSVSFRFRTLEPRGLVAIARGSSAAVNTNFVAVEIFDGRLFFVYDLGTLDSRKHVTDRRVDDGEWHDVEIRADGNRMIFTLDGQQVSTTLSQTDVARLYFYRLFVGGYDNMERAPWALYSRQGYRGCIESLKINSIGVDLHSRFRDTSIQGVEIGCRAMPRFCQTQPCVSGFCSDRMGTYVCDCANTPFTGQNCDSDAFIAGWDGTKSTNFEFTNRDVTHTNDISFRFMTPLKNTLLFRTEVDNSQDYIQAELVEGRVKVTMMVGGKTKTFFTGENLNDYIWHTLYLRRRANDVEIQVDDSPLLTGLIDGENFKLMIDRIKFGSLSSTGTGSLSSNNYIGYMQNFIYDNQDLFAQLKGQNSNVKWWPYIPSEQLPFPTYYPVTVKSSEAYFQLPSLQVGKTMKLVFKFKTRESNGLILYNKGIGNDVIALELSNGFIRLAYNLGGRNMFTVVPSKNKLNDNMWHTVLVGLNERGQFSVRVDSDNIDVSTSDGDRKLDLSGALYIAGLPQDMFQRSAVSGLIESRKGFRGCLASMDLNGGVVQDLPSYARDKTQVLNGCIDLEMTCKPNACGPGVCNPGLEDYWCNCNMTGFVGIPCTDFPTGYYFGKNDGKGLVIYQFPLEKQTSSNLDQIAFGFMTEQEDGVLYRLESSLGGSEFIEIRMENGFVVAESNTGGGITRLLENSQKFNNGKYHVVRYIRTGSNSTLQVNQLPMQTVTHSGTVSLFDKVYTVLVGGKLDARGAQMGSFNGIIGGAYYNGHRWFDMLLAGKTLHGKLVQTRGQVVLVKPFILVKGGGKPATPSPPDIIIPPGGEIPTDIGGGGIIGPDLSGTGTGGGGPMIGGPGGITGVTGGSGFYVPGAGPAPLASAMVGPSAPPMATGARAGAVVGTVIGTLAFFSSLMWALYKLKPGVPTCLSPGAGSAGAGGGGMSISAPQGKSNIGALQAASAGGGGAGGAGAGGGAGKVTVVNGSAAGGGAGGAGGGGSSTYTSYFQSTNTSVGGAGGGGAGGAGGADQFDSANLRATGTFSNKGTAIGSPGAGRAHLGSSSSAYSANYQSNTLQSNASAGGGGYGNSYDRNYMAGGDNIPDYDLPVAGTMQSGNNYSSSTLNTHYNYQVSGTNKSSNFATRQVTPIINPAPKNTSVLSVILNAKQDTPSIPVRHMLYNASVAPVQGQGFVDRSEDMVIQVAPPTMYVRPMVVIEDVDGDGSGIHSNDTLNMSGSASYKSQTENNFSNAYSVVDVTNSSFNSSERSNTLNTRSEKNVNLDTNRKASLQITPHFNARKDGYEQLDSYSSDTNISSYSSTNNTLPSMRSSNVSQFDNSRDTLYESTTTITSTVRSDSVENNLFSLEEETGNSTTGKIDLLMASLEDFNKDLPEPIYKTDTKHNDDNVYAQVDKSKKNKHKTSSSIEMDNLNFNVTCNAQLKETEVGSSAETFFDQSALTFTDETATDQSELSFTDTIKQFENFAVSVDETSGVNCQGTGGSQIERSENVIEISKPTFKRQASKQSIEGKSFGYEFTPVLSKSIEPENVQEGRSDQTNTEKSWMTTSFTTTVNKQGKDHGASSEGGVISIDVGTIVGCRDESSGPDLEDELNKHMHDLLTGIKVDRSRWGDIKDKTSLDKTDVVTADDWKVQNQRTVTQNNQGHYVLTSSGFANSGAVTPGAAADEVRVDCCLMTGGGRNVVTGSSLGPPQVWDMQNGELQTIMKGDTIGSTNLHLVCGDRLLVGAVHADMEINEYSGRKGVFNHTLQIWDFQTGKPLSMAEGEYCSALCPMSDSDKVLFGRTDKFGDATSIIAWDLMGNQMIKEMRYDAPIGNNDYISYLNRSKNDRYVLAGFTNSFDNCAEFMVFDMNLTSYSINEPAMLKLDADPNCTAILPKDEAVTGLRNGDLVIWSMRTGQPSRQLLGGGGAHAHSKEVKAVTLSEDEKYLVSASADGTLKVWDMHTERPLHTLAGHSDEVWCSAISVDNEIVVSGSSDGTIRLWRMKNGTEMCVFNCGVDIFHVTMSHDKGTIVALGDKFGARKLIMLQVVRTKIKKIVSS